ncbi:hypothetical protein [Nocardia sp. alder85J]|uniref:hypothetical protein n=1 Tax=Nocardia sp. alder85J TaxID=2862949 RepID=UPI001CD3CB45|nr:hypothetical protein [Nocardia sp. alder85J]MCX4097935.1 hypothetical protein [Nocardia sp. alder85J]
MDAYNGNLALWALSDAATAAAPHRDHDCTFFTATLRAALGRHRTATGAPHSLRIQLGDTHTHDVRFYLAYCTPYNGSSLPPP